MATVDQEYEKNVNDATKAYDEAVTELQAVLAAAQNEPQQRFDLRVAQIDADRNQAYQEALKTFDQEMEPHRKAFQEGVELASAAWSRRTEAALEAYHRAMEVPSSEVQEIDTVSHYPNAASSVSGLPKSKPE